MNFLKSVIEKAWPPRNIGYFPFSGKASFAPDGNYIDPKGKVWTSFEGVWTDA